MTQTIATITRASLPDLARITEGVGHAAAAGKALEGAVSKLGGATTVAFGQQVNLAGDLSTAFTGLVKAEDSVHEVAPEAGTLISRLRDHAKLIGNFAGMYDAAGGAKDLEALQSTKLAVPTTLAAAQKQAETAIGLIEKAAADDTYTLEARTEMVASLPKFDDTIDAIGRVKAGAAGSTTFSSSLGDAASNLLDARRALRLVKGPEAASVSDQLIASAFDVQRASGNYASVERSTGLAADTTGLSTRAEKLTEYGEHVGKVQQYLQVEADAVKALAADVVDTTKKA